MKVDGIVGSPVRRVKLDDFFGGREVWVDIKAISPYGRSLVREIQMEGFIVGEVDTKGKVADVKTNPKGQADRDMKVREVKLRHAFAGTNIMADGQAVPWDQALWSAMDEANPAIIDKIIDSIDEVSKLGTPEDGESDPT
jgi:hypothetical protein